MAVAADPHVLGSSEGSGTGVILGPFGDDKEESGDEKSEAKRS